MKSVDPFNEMFSKDSNQLIGGNRSLRTDHPELYHGTSERVSRIPSQRRIDYDSLDDNEIFPINLDEDIKTILQGIDPLLLHRDFRGPPHHADIPGPVQAILGLSLSFGKWFK